MPTHALPLLGLLLLASPAWSQPIQVTGPIEVRLTWSTPNDPDESDTEGSNVDLHLRHPNASDWFDVPWDAYAANPQPDWGAAGAVNDPQLLADDTDGMGPESITLAVPEAATHYRVGVEYTDDNGYGTAFATVRVFDDGVLVFEQIDSQLTIAGDFVEVVELVTPAASVPALSSGPRLLLGMALLALGAALARRRSRQRGPC